MRKALVALSAAAVIAVAAIAAPTGAEARPRGGAVAAGIIGGIAAGAIIGGALAGPPAYGYGPGPVYVAPGYEPEPNCYYTRQRVWDEYYGVWRRGPRVLVCP